MFSSWCTHCVQRPQKNVWLLAPIKQVVPLTLVDESKCLAVLQCLSYTLVMCTNPCRGWMWDEDGRKRTTHIMWLFDSHDPKTCNIRKKTHDCDIMSIWIIQDLELCTQEVGVDANFPIKWCARKSLGKIIVGFNHMNQATNIRKTIQKNPIPQSFYENHLNPRAHVYCPCIYL
jgi:hypothetical protein